ncbi:unnamed protein product [Rangifer tarandus platyrhynchus]|uniref:Uncharacterized protein n=1 Tax=Rangifer tarandus platyrhynchus TaxID=3082113 RepID=A0AC59ZFB1_RANTA
MLTFEKAAHNLGLLGKRGWTALRWDLPRSHMSEAHLQCPGPPGSLLRAEISAQKYARGCICHKNLPGLPKDLLYFDLGRWVALRHVQVIKRKSISSSNLLGF